MPILFIVDAVNEPICSVHFGTLVVKQFDFVDFTTPVLSTI
jgi:hypothetical protein